MPSGTNKHISFTKKALLILAFIFLLPIVPMVFVGLKPELFRWLVLILIPIGLFAFFKPQPVPLMRTRLGAVGLMYLAGMAAFFGFSIKSENELLALKERDLDAYLSYLKENQDDESYLQALSELRPEKHKAEVEKRTAEQAAEQKRRADEAAAKEAQRIAEKERRDEERRGAREAEEAEKITKYVAQLEREIEGLENFDPKTYLDSQSSLVIGLALFSAYAKIYKEGENLSLSNEQEALRQSFKSKVISVQKRALPQFRDAYGPIMRNDLWEYDATARTFGSNFTTVEFVAGMFAANRNIKQFQETVSNTLHLLRFKQSRYKWYKEDDEYTYYDMSSLSDDVLVEWVGNGRYRTIE